jgi:DNA-binding NarL/FixJ family response regulator
MLPRMITVLLVDDYPAMRQLLRDILERYHDIQVIGEAPTGEEAVMLAEALIPAVVVIDIQLPTLTGIEATTLIKRKCPLTTVIALTAGASEITESAMRDAGAATVLSKADLLNMLYPAIIEECMVAKIAAHTGVSVLSSSE